MSEFKRRGLVKITNGKYEKDGVEKTRYVTVGEYFATDHSSRQAIKLYATAFSEEKWLNIYIDEEFKNNSDAPMPQSTVMDVAYSDNKKSNDVILEDIDDKPIDLSEIPF
jgi:hypothetical protein